MHDPMTVAFEIKNPLARRSPGGYRPSLVTVWHVDPEADGSDDACDWFGGRKLTAEQQKVRDQIAGTFAFEWHRSAPYERFGWFMPDGTPNYSTHAIVLAMFRIAANHHFGHWGRRAARFLRRHAYDILLFAENSCDSLDESIRQRHGLRDGDHRQQARRFASVVYAWILRAERPWWRHPRWHVHHWRLQIHPLQSLRRRLFSRCEECGRGFRSGESVVGRCWGEPPRRWFEWFRSERYIRHADCERSRATAVASSEHPTQEAGE